MTVYLSPVFNDEQLDNNGLPLLGGKLYWYQAGTSTPVTVYQDAAGSTPHTTPITLNSRGEPPAPIWLTSGQTYKCILQDSLSNQIRLIDNISGVNDVATPTISEWVVFGTSPSYVSSTTFSVAGDQTAIFTATRRVRVTISGSLYYGSVVSSTYSTGSTSVVCTMDSTPISAGITAVAYAFMNPAYSSFPVPVTIPSGTKMAFYQATPPTGWTTVTTGTGAGQSQNDSMMRIVTTGTTGGTSGNASPGHSPIYNNAVPAHYHNFTGTALATHNHTINDAGHNHTSTAGPGANILSAGGINAPIYAAGTVTSTATTGLTLNAISAGTPAGTLDNGVAAGGVLGQTIFQPRYMDFVIGQKT